MSIKERSFCCSKKNRMQLDLLIQEEAIAPNTSTELQEEIVERSVSIVFFLSFPPFSVGLQ